MMLATWKARTKSLSLDQLIPGTFLLYITVHLLDEAIFGFAPWAELRWGIPNYTVPKWLLHNLYFAFFLGLGYFIYRRDTQKFLPAGLGIVIWGLINGINHIVFSLIFLEYSPGLLTGLIFIAIAALAFQQVRQVGLLSARVIAYSVIAGLLYWGLPMTLFIAIDQLLGI